MDEQETPRVKRDTSHKRQSIVDAATRVFLDEGYESASMDRISEAAGASKRTVYNHFPSKDDLFRAVLEQFNAEMRALKKIPYESGRSLEKQLGDFADAEIAVVQNPTWMGLVKLLLSVFISHPDLAQEAMSKHAKSESGLTAWMLAAIQDGRLSATDPVLAARVFSSMMGGAFTWPAVYQGGSADLRTAELKRELIGAFLDRYGLRPKAQAEKRRS